MNSRNSKTTDPHRLLLNLAVKMYLKRKDKYFALSNLSIYYTWKNIKQSYKNNKFKISAATWNKECELPDESYSISDIQDYFEYILKKHGEKTVNPIKRRYTNKIGNRIQFKIKTGNYLELLTLETMKLLGSIKSKITKDENGENVPYLEITELALMCCNFVDNSYQHGSRVLRTFVPNKSIGQLLNISPINFTFLKTVDSEFSYIDVQFTDQNSKPLEIENKIKITLVINQSVKYKK